MFIAFWALMLPSSQIKRGRSMAPRSEQVMLSCPSSLPGHSDFPTPVTPILPVSPSLIGAYRGQSPAETLGSQVLPPLSFTACHWPYPGSPAGAHALFFPAGSDLLPVLIGSACIPDLRGLSLTRTLPAIAVPHSLRAFSGPCRGKFSHANGVITTRTRPLPTHP